MGAMIVSRGDGIGKWSLCAIVARPVPTMSDRSEETRRALKALLLGALLGWLLARLSRKRG